MGSVFAGRNLKDNVEYHPSRVIVGFDVSTARTFDVDSLNINFGVQLSEHLFGDALVLEITDNTKVSDKIKALENTKLFSFVEPDYKVQSLYKDGSSSYDLYGIDKISMPCVWSKFTNSSTNARVCVIDTGVLYTHPDLAANSWQNPWERKIGPKVDNDLNGYVDDVFGINAITNTGNGTDDHSHGTHCSGTIGAVKNNAGVIGVAPKSSIIPCKFLDASGSGYNSDAIKCINYCKTIFDKYRVMNSTKYQYTGIYSNSWGGGAYSTALYNAINSINSGSTQGLFIAAAGNSGLNADTYPMYPAAYNLNHIVSVAATNANDALASFSNYGATSVDLAAPGVNIVSTVLSNGYASYSGTSMATPHVAGVATLMAYKKIDATSAEIKNALLAGVDKIPNLSGKMVSEGRLNAFKSFNVLFGKNKQC